MFREIVGFRQDELGDWVAELSCLHAQYVRHRPPFQIRPWVLDDDERIKNRELVLRFVNADLETRRE
ncbi:MAG: DUF3565 domain-containing protein, partial [Nitrososphaerota archaeon]|nr:DUF3565 domain-containing protein [Nitrososphaerota archaeon]